MMNFKIIQYRVNAIYRSCKHFNKYVNKQDKEVVQ